MEDPDINECLSLLEPNEKPLFGNGPLKINYRPIIIPGLVYRTIIGGGFLQLMVTNDQYAWLQFNNMIKYYENQRQEAIEYLKKEAKKVTSKRLVVPPEEFLQWMSKGCIDLDTYVILRNCVLKKGYKKRMALRTELEYAKTLLAPIGVATSALISKVDVKEFSNPPLSIKETLSDISRKAPIAKNSIQFMCNLISADFLGLPQDTDAIPPYKQAICGLMFGLIAAKLVCTLMFRIISPKESLLLKPT